MAGSYNVAVPRRLLPVLLSALVACARGAAPGAGASPLPPPIDGGTPLPDPLPKIAGKVNGQTIPTAYVEIIAKRLLEESGGRTEDRPFAYRRALQQLIVRELLLQEALARNIKADDARVEAAYNEARVPYPDDRAWLSFLADQGMDADAFRHEIRAQQTVAALTQAEAAQVGSDVSDKQAREFYEAHPERFDSGERLRASHVLVRVPGDATQAQREELRKKAQGLRDRIAKGEDFAALARQFSGDAGSAPRGGELEVFHRGQMVPPFEAAAYALKPGELSELVETPFGFHVIKLHERIPALKVPFEVARERLVAALVEERRNERIGQLVAQLWAHARIETHL
jgi:peptidyl-prolyl cis-trans isomerase C